MEPDLPPLLTHYIDAQNRHDIEAMLTCFAPDARVRDEGKTLAGTEAVHGWLRETSGKYRIALEPLSYSAAPDGGAMVARISGTFPGSPINLTYRFEFAAGRIASLEIG